MDDSELVYKAAMEAKVAPEIVFRMTAIRALKLVGMLQLALRHPAADTDAHDMVHEMADQLTPIGPGFSRMIELGFHPEFDR